MRIQVSKEVSAGTGDVLNFEFGKDRAVQSSMRTTAVNLSDTRRTWVRCEMVGRTRLIVFLSTISPRTCVDRQLLRSSPKSCNGMKEIPRGDKVWRWIGLTYRAEITQET